MNLCLLAITLAALLDSTPCWPVYMILAVYDQVNHMNLPDFLEYDDAGFISLSGHRIGLHHVVRMYGDGSSVEMIAANYPSLPLALIHKLIAFYLDHELEVDAYVAEHEREMAKQISAAKSGPSIAELRQRLLSSQ